MNWLDLQARRRVCASALSLLLFALVCAILCLPRVEEPAAQVTAPAETVDQFRLSRDQLREQESDQLRKLLDDPASAPLLAEHLPELIELVQNYPDCRALTLKKFQLFTQTLPQERFDACVKALTALN